MHPHYTDEPDFRAGSGARSTPPGWSAASTPPRSSTPTRRRTRRGWSPSTSRDRPWAKVASAARSSGRGRPAGGLAEGLGAIHARGLVHRDLTPANVIMTGNGPRIIDFGIAKSAHASAVTSSGVVVGTLRSCPPSRSTAGADPAERHLLPRQRAGLRRHRDDPFQAPTIPGVITRILSGPPDLDPLSGELRGIIADCLAKDPSSRPSPGDLLARFSRPAPHDPPATAAPAPAPAPGSVPAAVPAPELRLAGAGGPARAAQGPSPASAAGPGRSKFATTTSALRPSPVSAHGPGRRQDGGAESPDASPGQISGPDDAARRAEATAKAKERTQTGDSLYRQSPLRGRRGCLSRGSPPRLRLPHGALRPRMRLPEYRAAPRCRNRLP